jgi:hypothetical protein
MRTKKYILPVALLPESQTTCYQASFGTIQGPAWYLLAILQQPAVMECLDSQGQNGETDDCKIQTAVCKVAVCKQAFRQTLFSRRNFAET